jgi:hypothetical protein
MFRRRWLAVVVSAGCAGGALAGCTPLSSLVKPQTPVPPPALIEAEGDSEESSQLVRGFFKPTRLPGGWSSEANEIEKNLGVR